jgi:antitoxin VapB
MIIGSGRIEDLALRLAHATGEDVETAIERAIAERLSRIAEPGDVDHRRAALDKFLAAVAGLPVLDNRSPDEIIGYGPDGLPE